MTLTLTTKAALGMALSAALAAPIAAQDSNTQNNNQNKSEQQELEALLLLLEEETAVATQTKLNADYVPGMVSILHSDDLINAGYINVSDALNQVAGFNTSVANNGDNRTIVRGIGATLNASNLKLMVDGVAFNRAVDGSADWVLRLPLEMIDRIEVVRGPGSPLYGEYAFSGTVNVIPKSNTSLQTRLGQNDLEQVSGHLNNEWDSGLSLQLNGSYWSKGNSGLQTNPDNFANGGHGFSPSVVYDHEQGQTLMAKVQYQNFTGKVFYTDTERGPGYGQNAAMPYELEPREETVSKIHLSQRFPLQENLDIVWQASYQNTEMAIAAYLPIPAGIRGPGGRPILRNEFNRHGSEESELFTEVSLHWQPGDSHSIYADLGYSLSEVKSGFRTRQAEGMEPVYQPEDTLSVIPGTERKHWNLTLQDQWQILDNLTITLGVRLDDYDDWGENLSPRLAAVWQASDHHLFKAQYAESFRPPTLQESHPGANNFPGQVPNIAPLTEEFLRSTEAAYIYKSAGIKLSTTLFYIEVEDLIEFYLQPGQPPYWRNHGDITSTGVEFEWVQKIGRSLEWNANLSYADVDNAFDEDKALTGSIEWLANMGITWHASDRFDHTLHYRYVGDQEGWELSIRQPYTEVYDSYNTLNYTLGVNRLFGVQGLTFRATANNLLDESYNTVPNLPQYPHGLPQGQRMISGQLDYTF